MTEILLPEWSTLLAIVPVVLISGFVHGALGLGFPMVATPLIAVFLDVKLAILVTLLPTAAVNIASIWNSPSALSSLRDYRVLAVATVGGAIVGSIVLVNTSAAPFKMLLALLIFFFLWASQHGVWPRKLFESKPLQAMLLVGILAGFAGGTTNVMVAILIVYFLTLEVPRLEMVVGMNLCFLLGKLTQIVVFFWAGWLGAGAVLATAPLAICALLALHYGQYVGANIPQQRYRRLLRVILALLAIVLLLQFALDVAGAASFSTGAIADHSGTRSHFLQ